MYAIMVDFQNTLLLIFEYMDIHTSTTPVILFSFFSLIRANHVRNNGGFQNEATIYSIILIFFSNPSKTQASNEPTIVLNSLMVTYKAQVIAYIPVKITIGS